MYLYFLGHIIRPVIHGEGVTLLNTQNAQSAGKSITAPVHYKKNKPNGWKTFQRAFPLTVLALPGLIAMILFRYLPMGGLILAFKRYQIPKGMFGSPWNGFENFKFLFMTKDFFIITRNTIGYNLIFIILDLVIPVALAIVLTELHNRRASKVYQTIFMAPYFLSWVVVSFIGYAIFAKDAGILNQILKVFGQPPVTWYSTGSYWPAILIIFHIWKVVGYTSVMYQASVIGIPDDYYEAAVVDGATKWEQIWHITLPCLKTMMITLSILAVGRMFYSDFGLFYQLPRNQGVLLDYTNVVDTYVYRALKETQNISMASAANFYQSILGFICIVSVNQIVRKIDADSAIF